VPCRVVLAAGAPVTCTTARPVAALIRATGRVAAQTGG
jgi:hypothetical protein